MCSVCVVCILLLFIKPFSIVKVKLRKSQHKHKKLQKTFAKRHTLLLINKYIVTLWRLQNHYEDEHYLMGERRERRGGGEGGRVMGKLKRREGERVRVDCKSYIPVMLLGSKEPIIFSTRV